MRSSLAFGCFVAGTVAFVRFFMLVYRLRRERIGPPPTKVHSWFPWLPGGRFTAAGDAIRRRMNGLMLLGWAFLIAGLMLSA